jgi:hypothetical protein
MTEEKKFDLKQLLDYFSDIGDKRWGITLQLEKFEKLFSPVKEGREELSLKHLVAIRDDYAFANWWKMPEIYEEDLAPLKGVFVRLKPQDREVIGKLFDLLMNIEIVSCVLRYIDPQNYGILSPPVENLLDVRGRHKIVRYLNYLGHLEELKNEYNFQRIADVDMALWSLANILNYSYLRHHSVYSKIYDEYKQTANLVKKIMADNALAQLKEEKPLYKAELFLDSDYVIAGMIAGRELDLFVKNLCGKCGINLKKRKKTGELVPRSIYELADKLADEKWISKGEKIEIEESWKLRCDITHKDEITVSRTDVKKMIVGVSKLKEKYE